MKRMIFMMAITVSILMTAACSGKTGHEGDEGQTPKAVPVEAYLAAEEERVSQTSFIGTIQPGKTVQLSFKTGGRIEDIFVSKGDRVKQGETIATLDKTDLAYAANLAKAQVEMVQAQVDKASNGATAEDLEQARLNVVKAGDGYQYAQDRFREVEELYSSGSASRQLYDQAKLEMNISESDLKLAQEIETQVKNGARFEEIKALSAQLESAKTEYQYRTALLADATLKANIEGTVMEVMPEKGEITGSGYPVAVIRNDERVIHVGVPEKELKRIKRETAVTVKKEEQEGSAGIIRISEIPDTITALYDIEISVDDSLDAPFGADVTVVFSFGSENGIFIPISAIYNDGQDYVYTISENKAVRKNITITGIDNFEARVTGLHEGDLMIISGVGRVSAGTLVSVKEE